MKVINTREYTTSFNQEQGSFVVSVIAVIPARYQSSRFPGKPLAMIAGKSLLQRTYENAVRCKSLTKAVIATDDQRIFEHAKSFCEDVFMTSPTCANGSERIIEVLPLLQAEHIINVQGDEPCLPLENLSTCIQMLKEGAKMASLVHEISYQEALDPCSVKCVMDQNKQALYFSRSIIPFVQKKESKARFYRHVGLYGYTKEFLIEYGNLRTTPLQATEDLEQLKVLEHGYRIQMAIVESSGPGVDRIEDLKKVEEYLCSQNTSS